jgi:hypothetical protein
MYDFTEHCILVVDAWEELGLCLGYFLLVESLKDSSICMLHAESSAKAVG